jgi:chemotaxis protein MotA
MDIASIFGFIVAACSIAFGYTMDGGNLRSLWLLSALVIVVGGSAGSVAISYGINELKKMPVLFVQTFRQPKSSISKTLEFLVTLAEHARKDGLLSLEKELNTHDPKNPIDPLLKRGMLMVIDGSDLEQIRDLMETDIAIFEEKSKNEISTFDCFAGYAPAYGMIGTIMGLVQALGNMESPEAMAVSIAVAFITTFYGVLIANMICLPASSKLKNRLHNNVLEKEMIVDGVCAIRNGQNPKLLRSKLSSYLVAETKLQKKVSLEKGEKQ